MAVLSDNDRAALRSAFTTALSTAFEPLGALTKAELRAALNAVDDWVDANQASFNAALPLPARTELTASQKARLLASVVQRRFDLGV